MLKALRSLTLACINSSQDTFHSLPIPSLPYLFFFYDYKLNESAIDKSMQFISSSATDTTPLKMRRHPQIRWERGLD